MSGGRGPVYAIAQARMGSTRLPGKVLLPLAGRSVVDWVGTRARRASVDGVVIGIPDGPEDHILADRIRALGHRVFRGDPTDVQSRYIAAADAVGAKTVVRLTCDNPLVDAALIDRLVESHRRSGAEYSSYGLSGPFPLGLAVEAFSVDALRRSRSRFGEPHHREHVTAALYENPAAFRLNPVAPPGDLRRADLRMTLDTAEDHEALSRLVALVTDEDPIRVAAQRYARLLADHPEIRSINAHVRQKGPRE